MFVREISYGRKPGRGVNILAAKALGIDKYVQSVKIFSDACVFLRHPFSNVFHNQGTTVMTLQTSSSSRLKKGERVAFLFRLIARSKNNNILL